MSQRDYSLNNTILHPSHIIERYCDEKWFFPPVFRDFHSLTLIISGEGKLYSEGQEYPMLPGMLVYNHFESVYGFGICRNKPPHLFGMNFSAFTAEVSNNQYTTKNIEQLPINQITHIKDPDHMKRLFRELVSAWEEVGPYQLIKCRGLLNCMLHEILRLQQIDTHKNIINKIEKSLQYIKKHYNNEITLQKLALEAGLSKVYFGNCFKKITGKTPFEYIHEVRIDKALEYLSSGFSIQETASRTGFSDPFYFSRVFKRLKGMSPRAFIQKPSNFF